PRAGRPGDAEGRHRAPPRRGSPAASFLTAPVKRGWVTEQDGPMRDTRVSAAGLREAIDRSGYYPDLVADAVDSALGKESVSAYVVPNEATSDPPMEARRHVTALVLPPPRLLVCHTDEPPPAEGNPASHASTTTEAVRLTRVQSVALTRLVPDPASYS